MVSGEVRIDDAPVLPGQMAVIAENDNPVLEIPIASRFMQLGGDTLDGDRHIWWNFVSSSKERIERAKQEWKDGRFDQVPGETEFIPLPE